MTVTPLVPLAAVPDTAIPPALSDTTGTPPSFDFARSVRSAFEAASGALERADRSEQAFARGAGDLQAMVLDRAQADIALSIATSAASHTAQALSTILGMQI